MDDFWKVFIVVGLAECMGGLITGLLYQPKKNQLLLWHPGEKCNVMYPGLLANVLIGGIAAVVYWSLYGPFSGAKIVGSGGETEGVWLTIGQFAGCILIGMGGPGYLYTEAKKRCLDDRVRKLEARSSPTKSATC